MIVNAIALIVFIGIIAAIYNFLNDDTPPRIEEGEHKVEEVDEAAERDKRRAAARERRRKEREARAKAHGHKK